jgi:hypothetical protein
MTSILEEMMWTGKVGNMIVTIERVAGTAAMMIETVGTDAVGAEVEAIAVAEAEVLVPNTDDVAVVAVPEIDLDVIAIQGVVLRIVIQISIPLDLTELRAHQWPKEC